MAIPRLCTVDGCSKSLFSRGWCTTHYQRWRLKGDHLHERPKLPTGCSVPDCQNPHDRAGLCGLHYMRQHKQGDALWQPKPLLAEPGLAKADPKAYGRLHYQANKAAYIASANARPDEMKQRARTAWVERNPEAVIRLRRRRKRTVRVATPPWLTEDQWLQIDMLYEQARSLTAKAGVLYGVDHIIPLQHPRVCGLHVPWNLQVMLQSDNLRKSNSFQPG